MLEKFENVYVKVFNEYSSNDTQKAFRKLEIYSANKLIQPISFFIDEEDFKNLPKNLSFNDDTEFDEPYNVILLVNEINFGNGRMLPVIVDFLFYSVAKKYV